MASGDDDEEIAGERPYHGAQHGQVPTEVESSEQDVEAQQIGEDIPYVLGQPEVIGIGYLAQQGGTIVGRGHLIGGHASEQGVGPAGFLTRTLHILGTLLPCPTSCRRIVTIEDTTLDVCREEVGKGDHCK